MKTLYWFFFVIFLYTNQLYCQDLSFDESPITFDNKNSHVINICAITPGVMYEYGIDHNKSLKFELGVVGITYGSLIPGCNAEYRIYYNFKRRALKQRRIKSFNGDFLSLYTGYTYTSFVTPPSSPYYYYSPLRDFLYIGTTWGFQRTIRKFNVGINLGLGYAYSPGYGSEGIAPLFDINLAYEIFNNK